MLVLLTIHFLAKADDEGQVVAEAALIAVTNEGTEGFYTAVLFVLLHEKRGVVDEGLVYGTDKSGADEDVVDALPAAVIAVGAGGTVQTSGCGGNVVQAVVSQVEQGWTVSKVIEVAADDDLGIRLRHIMAHSR